ncbi:bifunctional 23S rRNA (guanine(2069)-N(7))-methyltransferase RlmK/23S rRNA (guanine(2445)-N(2))-methyltransferase RlmL [Marinobacteraceae bacterium S3BR75-40.1]
MHFFVTCPKGIEQLLADELVSFGITVNKVSPAGVWGEGALEGAYRVCLASRLANRIILSLAQARVETPDDIIALAHGISWEEHLAPEGRLRVQFHGQGAGIRNTQFGALCIKDGIVDRMRELHGTRPSVDRQQPDLNVHARLHRGRLDLGIDLAGQSLHRRGYRTEAGAAPLKENLAAALLLRAGWPELAAQGGDLVDPLCGSGTLLIEAAMMACDMAPGLLREGYAFEKWPGHDDELWQRVRAEYEDRALRGRANSDSRYWGYDRNRQVVATAWRNIERAGLADRIHVERRELTAFENPSQQSSGLVITNPPYGERLSERSELEALYQLLGEQIRNHCLGWQLAVFTAVPQFGHALGLHSHRQYPLYNGSLPGKLLLFDVRQEHFKPVRSADAPKRPRARIDNPERARMFANRLRKNLKALKGWVRKNAIECYRLYDADMPEFALAVDVYGDWVHVQEYRAPASVDEKAAQARLEEALAVLPEALEVPAERIVLKQRRRQFGTQQYEKQDSQQQRLIVNEGQCRLYVNLVDYLDTGLFLDHRPIRLWMAEHARGKRFLNLFCYTGAATVHAVSGGAASSLSLDMSATYLKWAQENLKLNGLEGPWHRFAQVNCTQWLAEKPEDEFDLIFMDPPTFSNSKRMADVLDIQRDHGALIAGAMKRLAKEGELIFSTNFRKFKLDEAVAERWDVRDITRQTIDRDFARNPRIHQCWRIRHRG